MRVLDIGMASGGWPQQAYRLKCGGFGSGIMGLKKRIVIIAGPNGAGKTTFASDTCSRRKPMSMRISGNDPMVVRSMAAMRRAALRARKIARDTGTPLVVVRDGKVVHIRVPKSGRSAPGKKKIITR